jgi:hypothetical protein
MFPGCYVLHGDDNSLFTRKVEAALPHKRIPRILFVRAGETIRWH